MESTKADSSTVPFMQQLLNNKFLLLTVVLAIGAAVYFCVGLFVLLSQ